MSAPQDIHYRRLFSCPEMIRDLFDGVIGEPWRPLLDLRHLQPVNPTVPAAEAPRQRHADLVWLVPRTDGQALYVLLQLEHQSTVDGDMALRQAAYCCLLYQDLRRRRQVQRPARLPAVLSLVLYTGETPWRAPAELRELIDPVPAGLQAYQPTMRHLVIDQARLVAQGRLPTANLAASLFRLEHSRDIDDLVNVVHTIDRLTTGQVELRTAFTAWINHILLPRVALDDGWAPGSDLPEIADMMADRRHPWSQGLIDQGRLLGREEGREEGLGEGLRTSLALQLTHKFGVSHAQVANRLDNATREQLQRWQIRVLDADSLEAVFDAH